MANYAKDEFFPKCVIDCGICKKSIISIRSLSKHIRDYHKEITIKDYYDNFIKKTNFGQCLECGKNTSFQNIGIGYSKFCNQKCACTFNRRVLSNDPEKLNIFKSKVSKNQTKIWYDRSTDTKKEIIEKAKDTNNRNIALLSEDERKQKFGWINKLPDEIKSEKIQEILEKSLKKWWANASQHEKETVYSTRFNTMVFNGNAVDRRLLDDWQSYTKKARILTEKNYKKYKSIINPNNLPRGRGSDKYQVDHILSIFDGFFNGVTVEEISSYHNLQMLNGFSNNKKHKSSWITVEELYVKVYKI